MATAKTKRKFYLKEQFDDKQAYDQVEQDIIQIRGRNLSQVEEEAQILKLYQDKKQELRRNKILQKKVKQKKSHDKQGPRHALGQDDEEQGQLSDNHDSVQDKKQAQYQNVPSISDLGQYIRPITLTRNKVCQLLMSRKFQDIVKGCFVRYKSDNPTDSNPYLLAQVVSTTQGPRQYTLNKSTRTRKFLKLQQTSTEVIALSIQLLSNQHPPGSLQISQWLQANRNKIPKEKQLKQKLQQLNNLIYGKVTAEQIDKNIYIEAQRIAQGKKQHTNDVSKYIYFMESQLHDLKVGIDELETEREKSKIQERSKKEAEKQKCQRILQRLKEIKIQIAQEQAQKKKEQEQQEKKARNKNMALQLGDRKEDNINQKVKSKTLTLFSYQGSNKIRKQLKQIHKSHKLEVQL